MSIEHTANVEHTASTEHGASTERAVGTEHAVGTERTADTKHAVGTERTAGTAQSTSNTQGAQDFWNALRSATQSRIGLGRAGDALPTARVLEFRAAHAAARDAVHLPMDTAALVHHIEAVGLGTPVVVRSRAADRPEYLRRPDLGRLPHDPTHVPRSGADIGFVLADGLSPRALMDHGAPLLSALASELAEHYSLAPPVIATQARVALGDHIASAQGVRTLIVLIGERPGLSVADSLGIYLTHHPRPGRTDADRNCVSNIHPPEGLGYEQAARVVAGLVAGARRLGRSGVDLKDTSRADPLTGPAHEMRTLESAPRNGAAVP